MAKETIFLISVEFNRIDPDYTEIFVKISNSFFGWWFFEWREDGCLDHVGMYNFIFYMADGSRYEDSFHEKNITKIFGRLPKELRKILKARGLFRIQTDHGKICTFKSRLDKYFNTKVNAVNEYFKKHNILNRIKYDQNIRFAY